jgi:hypothetical protein
MSAFFNGAFSGAIATRSENAATQKKTISAQIKKSTTQKQKTPSIKPPQLKPRKIPKHSEETHIHDPLKHEFNAQHCSKNFSLSQEN